jgi:hypothetical protein
MQIGQACNEAGAPWGADVATCKKRLKKQQLWSGSGVARFGKHTKTGKIYQITTKDTNSTQNTPNGLRLSHMT